VREKEIRRKVEIVETFTRRGMRGEAGRGSRTSSWRICTAQMVPLGLSFLDLFWRKELRVLGGKIKVKKHVPESSWTNRFRRLSSFLKK